MSSPTEAATKPDFTTTICLEQPLANNPYVAERRYISGYNVADLWRNCHYCDGLHLLLTGELPTQPQRRLLEILLLGLLNPGPRHPAVRAAMLAGVSKTGPEHLLPLGLLTGSGVRGGALEVEQAWAFINSHLHQDAPALAVQCLAEARPTPGFGSSFGVVEPIWQQLAGDLIAVMPEEPVLSWCRDFCSVLHGQNQGWLLPGLVAAVGLMLGLDARKCIGLWQLALAPAVMAHGMEQTHKPISSNALLRDDQYDCD